MCIRDSHRANGGYLVLEAEELLRQYLSYDALKRALKDDLVCFHIPPYPLDCSMWG